MGSYGCVGDGLVCEQGKQPWPPCGFSTLSAAPSFCAQGVSFCDHNAPGGVEKNAQQRDSQTAEPPRGAAPVPLSAGNILGAPEMGEKLTNCCSEEDGKQTHTRVWWENWQGDSVPSVMHEPQVGTNPGH